MKGTLTRRLEELIGHEATERLIATYRGELLYIPRPGAVNPDHPLALALGLEAALAVAAEWGGQRISIPVGQESRGRARRDAVAADRAAGLSVRQIGQKHKISPRQVYNLLAKARADSA